MQGPWGSALLQLALRPGSSLELDLGVAPLEMGKERFGERGSEGVLSQIDSYLCSFKVKME